MISYCGDRERSELRTKLSEMSGAQDDADNMRRRLQSELEHAKLEMTSALDQLQRAEQRRIQAEEHLKKLQVFI